MSDEMTLFLLIIAVILILIYRRTRNGVYSDDMTLDPGDHRIGEDLAPGKGDLVVISGTGSICIKERGKTQWNNPFKLSADNPALPTRYRNLTLHANDILQINGNVSVKLTPPTPIADGEGAELTLGSYQFGQDIPPAKYDLTAVSGDGQFSYFAPKENEFSIFQDMSSDAPEKTSVYRNLVCEEGSRLVVAGSLKLKLSRSKKQRGHFNKLLELLNQNP